MKKDIHFIRAGKNEAVKRQKQTGKRSWRVEMVKKAMSTLQHISPKKTAEVVWHYFTQPGKPRYNDHQLDFVESAQSWESRYRGARIRHYRWGDPEHPKILVCHGWRSKAADFRKMILTLVEAGYCVEGMDMKAHGQSEGKHSALPEFRDILKDHYVNYGPFRGVIGHSLGGLAAGIVSSELASNFQPPLLFLMAFPPYPSYFFQDIISDLGFRHEVFVEMSALVDKHYDQPIDYFDLRKKSERLRGTGLHLIYDRQDTTVSIAKGYELYDHYPEANFVESQGLGHNKILTHPDIIKYIIKHLSSPKVDV